MRLRKIIRNWGCVLALFAFPAFAFSTTAYGQMRMMTAEYKTLNGMVMSIDPAAHAVTVDVKTYGCEGEKTFYIDDLGQFQASVGDEIKFFVDSEYCPTTPGHKMFPKGKGRKQ